MASFRLRVCGGLIGAAIMTPIASGAGALAGYIYAKLADLPAGRAAQACAVWLAVENALMTLAAAISEKPSTQVLIKIAVFTITSIIGIQELQKRGILGDKMVTFLIVLRALAILGFLTKPVPHTIPDDAEIDPSFIV